MFLKSQTWDELKLLLRELPPKRLRFLALVLLASLLQGLIDIFLVGLLARLVGLLAGAKLGDQIPGIRFFGGGMLDQAGWIVALLIAAYWLASGIRFGVALLESLLTAEIWISGNGKKQNIGPPGSLEKSKLGWWESWKKHLDHKESANLGS